MTNPAIAQWLSAVESRLAPQELEYLKRRVERLAPEHLEQLSLQLSPEQAAEVLRGDMRYSLEAPLTTRTA